MHACLFVDATVVRLSFLLCVSACVCVYIYIYVCVCVCACVCFLFLCARVRACLRVRAQVI